MYTLGWIFGAAMILPITAHAADIHQRTSIVCVSDDTKSLVSVPHYAGTSKSDRAVSSFTQWMFEADKTPSPSRVRFLWIPHTSNTPPVLKIFDANTNHAVVDLLSETRHGILAATSASERVTNVGWMFAINFKSEQVIATSIYSNVGGARGRAFSYSCRFHNDIPAVELPLSGGGVG